jgi:hypothetical protein
LKPKLFQDLLGHYIFRERSSANRLEELTGVSRQNIFNWLNFYLPRDWKPILKLAAALHLTETETDGLLVAAKKPKLAQLRVQATGEDWVLLQPWAASPSNPPIYHRPPPYQAPLTVATFVGREAELADLEHRLLAHEQVMICGLRGMGGVGKTSLAALVAHRLRPHFPDGVLWARLDTTDALAVLGQFAFAFGKDVSHLSSVSSRAAIVRDLLHTRRVLMVLDNAEDDGVVKALLPSDPSPSAVLITTRADLSALDGWHKVELKPFDAETSEAQHLLERHLGPAKAWAGEHQAAWSEIAALLGHLPLALAIIAGKLANAPNRQTALEELLPALRSETARLGTLARGEQAVRVSFDMSFNALAPEQQTMFALLGVFGGADFNALAVAHLGQISAAEAEAHLQHFMALSLLQEVHDGRWRLHPLLRDYAREKLIDFAALNLQLVQFYSATAEKLNGASYATLLPDLDNVLAALRAAPESAELVRAVTAFLPILQALGLYAELGRHADRALTFARAHSQPPELARLLAQVMLFEMNGRNSYERAQELGLEAARLAETHADWKLAVEAWAQLARNAQQTRHYTDEDQYAAHAEQLAQHHHVIEETPRLIQDRAFRLLLRGHPEQAERELRVFIEQAQVDRADQWVQTALERLGYLLHYRGRFKEADACYRESLALAERLLQKRPPFHLAEMAENLLALQRFDDAWAYITEALPLVREGGSSRLLMVTLINAGDVLLARHQWAEAERQWHEAYELAYASRSKVMRGVILGRLGQLALWRKDRLTAERYLQEAFELLQSDGNPSVVGFAHYWLAEYAHAQNNLAGVREHGQMALQLFEQIGYWRAEEVRAWLNQLPS